jgi:outer membrane immunogenic protein
MGRLSSGLLAFAAAAAVSTTAFAADLPVPAAAPAYGPPVYRPALYDWTGIYFGGHAGVGAVEDTVTDPTTTALTPAGTQTKVAPYGLIGGGQAGFNLEFNPVVVGAEATWTADYISGTQATPSPFIAGTTQQSTSAPHWYATATGKIGFARNDLLFYAKGGAAWMHVDYTQDILVGGVIAAEQIIIANRYGYTVGGGVEYAFNESLSARLEYDFLDFGTQTYTFNNLAPVGGPLPVAVKSQTHMLTAGMNYRFNWGGGGYAKY